MQGKINKGVTLAHRRYAFSYHPLNLDLKKNESSFVASKL